MSRGVKDLQISSKGPSGRDRKLGNNSHQNKDVNLDEQGVIEWLLYAVMALVTTLFGIWNKHISGRIKKIEDTQDNQWSAIHRAELNLNKQFADHEIEERDRDANHAADVSREFKELRQEINTGHNAILKEVNSLARSIRNGHGKS